MEKNSAAFSCKVLVSGAESGQQAGLGSHQYLPVSWCGMCHICSSLPLKMEPAACYPRLLRGQSSEK